MSRPGKKKKKKVFLCKTIDTKPRAVADVFFVFLLNIRVLTERSVILQRAHAGGVRERERSILKRDV